MRATLANGVLQIQQDDPYLFWFNPSVAAVESAPTIGWTLDRAATLDELMGAQIAADQSIEALAAFMQNLGAQPFRG